MSIQVERSALEHKGSAPDLIKGSTRSAARKSNLAIDHGHQGTGGDSSEPSVWLWPRQVAKHFLVDITNRGHVTGRRQVGVHVAEARSTDRQGNGQGHCIVDLTG
jgi:hypothetical protein